MVDQLLCYNGMATRDVFRFGGDTDEQVANNPLAILDYGSSQILAVVAKQYMRPYDDRPYRYLFRVHPLQVAHLRANNRWTKMMADSIDRDSVYGNDGLPVVAIGLIDGTLWVEDSTITGRYPTCKSALLCGRDDAIVEVVTFSAAR